VTEWSENTKIQLGSGELGREEFSQLVDYAVSLIRRGDLEKVVLARDLIGSLPDKFDLRPTLDRLSKRFPSCWVYSVDGMFGASPELLVRVSHSQVSARVLAGTAARGTDPSVDLAISKALAESHKNLAEHEFAVQSLVNALEPFCDHVDADTEPFSLQLPNLWHLASDVHGVLKSSKSVLDLASALHPTAAVAGTPRDKAVELIAELEPFDRGRYAGPVGWIGADGDGEWVIALRGAQISGSKITAFAGCGVVAESEGDAELTETDLKFQPILGALG
jgi:menaquinone-specific isochorismate synthase